MSDTLIVVRRPGTHHKGPKTTAVWEYGKPVPSGVLIGKGAIITVEPKEYEEVFNGIQPEDCGPRG